MNNIPAVIVEENMNKKKENKTYKEDWKLKKIDCMTEMDIHFNPRPQMDAG